MSRNRFARKRLLRVVFDAAMALLWSAMVLAFVAGVVVDIFWPQHQASYPADSGICDSGCPDIR